MSSSEPTVHFSCSMLPILWTLQKLPPSATSSLSGPLRPLPFRLARNYKAAVGKYGKSKLSQRVLPSRLASIAN